MDRCMRALVAVAALVAALGIRPVSAVPVPVIASPNVELLASFPNETGAVGGQVRDIGGTPYFLMTGVGGVSAYDISNPAVPVPAGHLPLPHFENESVDGRGNLLLVDVDPAFTTSTVGGLYTIDVSDPSLMTFAYSDPVNLNKFKGASLNGKTYNGGHTIACIRSDCSWAYDVGPGGGNGFVWVFDLRDPARPDIAGWFASPVGSTHHADMDESGTVWLVGGGGVAALDTTDPIHPSILGSYNPQALDYIHNSTRRGDTLLVTEEDWLQPACVSQGQFATVDVSDLRAMRTLDIWKPPAELAPHNQTGVVTCSAHWFTERNDIVAIGWYQEGTYFLDVSDPTHIQMAGFFAPVNSTSWAAYWVSDDIVYVTDQTRGLEVLRFTRSTSAAVGAAFAAAAASPRLLPAADLARLEAHPYWGFACSIARVV